MRTQKCKEFLYVQLVYKLAIILFYKNSCWMLKCPVIEPKYS